MNQSPNESNFEGFEARSEANADSASGASNHDAFEPMQQAAGSAEIELLQAEVAEAQERAFRIAAELDNFRKRARRELEDALRYAQLPLAKDLLGVVDNLQRAMQAASEAEQNGSLVEGVRMVVSQLQQVLKTHHCEPIASLGQPFDPNCHEALQMEQSSEYGANIVSRELSTGYRLHDRVLRPAQVFVSTGPGPA